MRAPNSRNDVTQRRRWLRELDIALCEELDDGGSSMFKSLREEVADRALLSARASDESLWEWWHYAQRRGIIEPGAHRGEMSLSDRGRARLEEAQRDAVMPSSPKARALVRYLIPPGLTGLLATSAAGLLGKSLVPALVAACVIAIALIYWLTAEVLDYVSAKWIDPHLRRALLRNAVAWLDGDEVRLFGRTRHPAVEKASIRRLAAPSMPVLPPLPEAPGGLAPADRSEAQPSAQPVAAAGSPSSTSLSSSTD